MLTVAFGESTMSRTQIQLWYNRFQEGRKAVNDDARPSRQSRSTTDGNIEAVKKMILDNCRSLFERLLLMLAYRSAHAKQFLRIFGHETCRSEDCSKNAKFCLKTSAHGHRSGDVEGVQRQSRFAQKGHNW